MIAVVIPCFKATAHILQVVKGLPPWVDKIYVVDDACPVGTGKFLQQNHADPRLSILFHTYNTGVGGATITGYRAAMQDNCHIIVKMDSDDQMDPAYLARLIRPILAGNADFAKGNRFFDLDALRQMPAVRRTGNLGLTLLTKVAAGYWHVSDPTNGYTAVHSAALKILSLNNLAPRYFFESSMLIQLNIARAVVVDIPIPARYGTEVSSLNIKRVLLEFPVCLAKGALQRLVWRYFIHDINAVSCLLVIGGSLCTFGLTFGIYHWILSGMAGIFSSSGTVALATLPLIIGFQMLLQALLLDTMEKPSAPLQSWFSDESTDEELPCN